MMLVLGVSKRILPSLDRHMRDADWDGGPPPAGWVFVAQSEQNGGVGVCGIWTTAGASVARNRRRLYRLYKVALRSRAMGQTNAFALTRTCSPGTIRPGLRAKPAMETASKPIISRRGFRPLNRRSSRRRCSPIRVLRTAPDEASCPRHYRPGYRCQRYCRAIRWDSQRV